MIKYPKSPKILDKLHKYTVNALIGATVFTTILCGINMYHFFKSTGQMKLRLNQTQIQSDKSQN